jgi:hypothetical protein
MKGTDCTSDTYVALFPLSVKVSEMEAPVSFIDTEHVKEEEIFNFLYHD